MEVPGESMQSETIPSCGSMQSETSLTEFQKHLTNEDIIKFTKRFDNGYDLDVDPIYNQWKQFKMQR